MYQESPFHLLTRQLLKALDNGQLNEIEALLSHHFSALETTSENQAISFSNAGQWKNYVNKDLITRDIIGTEWKRKIHEYHDIQTLELAYSVVLFTHQIKMLDLQEVYYFEATLNWRKEDNEWKLSRWHNSLLRKEVE